MGTHSHHGGAAQQQLVAEWPAQPTPPPATHGILPTQAAPAGVTRSAAASPSFASLGLGPCAPSPARAQGDNAGGSGGAGPQEVPTPALMRLTANDAPSPLGPLDTHTSAHAHPPTLLMARQRQHTTPPPIAFPRDNAGGSGSAGPQAPAPALPHLTASGTPSPLGPLNAHVGDHTHPSSPNMAHQRQRATPPPPWHSHASHRRLLLRAYTPLRWRETSNIRATPPTTTVCTQSRPGPLLPLPSKYLPSFCTYAGVLMPWLSVRFSVPLLLLTPPRERRLLLPLSTWTQGLVPPPLLTTPIRRKRGVVCAGRHTKPVERLSMPLVPPPLLTAPIR